MLWTTPRERPFTRDTLIATERSSYGAPEASPAVHRLAIIDLGSNTVRVLVADVSANGIVQVVDEESVPLQLARALGPDRLFTDRTLAQALDALSDFALIARAAGAETIVAVGTSALRDSANSGALTRLVRRRLGFGIELLEGDDEARYAFEGAVFGLPIEDGLVADLGGGSLELSEFRSRRLTRTWSLPLGALRIADDFMRSDPPTPGELKAATGQVRRMLAGSGVPPLPEGASLVGTGGSIRNLARIDRRGRRYPLSRLPGYVLTARGLRRAQSRILAVPTDSRGGIAGLNPERAQSIVGGAIVLDTLVRHVRAREVVIAGEGLREGRARAMHGRPMPSIDRVRMAGIRHLHARFPGVDHDRPEPFAALCVVLERELSITGVTDAEILRDAARLVGLGTTFDFYNRATRAADVVLAAGLPGFSHRELARISAVLRLAERPDASLAPLRPLVQPEDVGALQRSGSILALADAIARRIPTAKLASVTATLSGATLTLEVPAWSHAVSESLVARTRRELGVELIIRARR